MYYNIANRVITPTLTDNYNLVSDVTSEIQTSLNEAAGIGIKAVKPELNQDRIDGIINRISSEDNYDDVSWILDEPVKNFSQSIVDDSVKANTEFHAKAGLQPKIVRKLAGKCCEWCTKLAGTYSYPDVPKDVYRRHENCVCVLDYIPQKGKIQNIWKPDDEVLEKRKQVGIDKEVTKDEVLKRLSIYENTIENISHNSIIKTNLQFFTEKDLKNQSSASIERSINTFKKRIEEHESYLRNPIEHCPDWNEKSIAEQNGLKRHWQKEINNFNQSIQNRIEELKIRGDYNG